MSQLFTDLSAEQQEIVAGGKKSTIENDTTFSDKVYFGPLKTVANGDGASIDFGGFNRDTYSDAYLDLIEQ